MKMVKVAEMSALIPAILKLIGDGVVTFIQLIVASVKTRDLSRNNRIALQMAGQERMWLVAPGRFELPSQDPESRMIDRYTTGLKGEDMTTEIVDKFNL